MLLNASIETKGFIFHSILNTIISRKKKEKYETFFALKNFVFSVLNRF